MSIGGKRARATTPAVADPIQTLADELHARHDGARAATLYREIIDRAVARTADNQEEVAWNYYYYADSLRMKHDLESARRDVDRGEKAATGIDNDELHERIDLLDFYLARDADACTEARQAIDRFLAEHPEGVLVDLARDEAATVENGGRMRVKLKASRVAILV